MAQTPPPQQSRCTWDSITSSIFAFLKKNTSAILLAFITFIISGFWKYILHRARKLKRACLDPLQHKDDRFRLIATEAPSRFNRQDLVQMFYTGKSSQPFECVRSNLDAQRFSKDGKPLDMACLEAIETAICKGSKFVHLPIWASRNEGKTTFLARLAFSAERSGRYRVIWWNDAKPAVSTIDGLIAKNHSRIQRLLAPRRSRKTLMVVVDDLLRNSLALPEEDLAWKDEYLRFISGLESLNIVLVSSWIRPYERYGSALAPVHLQVTRKDHLALLAKLSKEVRPIPTSGTRALAANAWRHGNQLFAFYCNYYDHLAQQTGETKQADFIGVYEKGYSNLDPAQKELVHKIGACQSLHLLLPQLIWESSQSNREILSKLPSIRLEGEEPGIQAAGYTMGGPFLAHWLLVTKARLSPVDVYKLYVRIIDSLICNPKLTGTEFVSVREILDRLQWPHFDILGFGNTWRRSSARSLYAAFKDQIADRLITTDRRERCRWIFTLNNLAEVDAAVALLSRTLADEHTPTTADVDADLNKAVHMSLSRFYEEDHSRARQALNLLDLATSVSTPDALLMQLQGAISEDNHDLQTANDVLKKAMASSANGNPFTHAMCAQRYGLFLGCHPEYSETNEKTESLFSDASKNLAAIGKVNSGIFDAWAQWRISQGDFLAADALFSASEALHRSHGRVHVQTWISYANFLLEHFSDFDGAAISANLEKAELLSREIIDYFETNTITRLKACTWLGRLIGLAGIKDRHPAYSFRGVSRPCLSDAIAFFQKACDLSEGFPNALSAMETRRNYSAFLHEATQKAIEDGNVDRATLTFEKYVEQAMATLRLYGNSPVHSPEAILQRKYLVREYCKFGWFVWTATSNQELANAMYQKASGLSEQLSDVEFIADTRSFYTKFLNESTRRAIAASDIQRACVVFDQYIEQMSKTLAQSPDDRTAARHLGQTWTILPYSLKHRYVENILAVLWKCWCANPENIEAATGLLSWARASSVVDWHARFDAFAIGNALAAISLAAATAMIMKKDKGDE